MIEEPTQNELESLSRAWSERIKNIRHRAKKDESPRRSSEAPPTATVDVTGLPDDQLFVHPVHEDSVVQDIFAGDDAFYSTLEAPESAHSSCPTSAASAFQVPKRRRFALKMLAGCGVLACIGALLYTAVNRIPVFLEKHSAPAQVVSANPPLPSGSSPASEKQGESTVQADEQLLDREQPLSLQAARDYYQMGEFRRAAAVYRRLLQALPSNEENALIKDFLELNIAFCMQHTAAKESMELLKQVASSRSPIIRVLANYRLCQLETERRQYFAARTRAYQAIASLDAIDSNPDWTRQIRRDCYFLAAESLSREVLSLKDADHDLPNQLWPQLETGEYPLFAETEQENLKKHLQIGLRHFERASLSPEIRLDNSSDVRLWTVCSNGASISELLNRFSVNSGYEMQWEENVPVNCRQRAVSLYLTNTNDSQFMTVAAGCAGLLLSLNADRSVTIHIPDQYTSASENLSRLTTEAISCWEKYLRIFYNDVYAANAGFALGLLKTQQGLAAEALSAFKTIPARYPKSELGPGALVCSADLKTKLQDSEGAYTDLKEAVEQYPDHDGIEKTYAALADTAQKLGRADEAAKLYGKIYYLNTASEFKSQAALEAGKVFYGSGDFAEAEIWFTRYINLAEASADSHFHQGCLFLGKTWLALDNREAACRAFQAALSGRLSQQDYVDTITALTGCYLQQEKFIDALQVLDQVSAQQFSQKDAVEILLLKCTVLRELGLTDKAVALLRTEEEYMIDKQLKFKIGRELSKCYIELGQLDAAYEKLAQLLETAPPGQAAHQAAYQLAQVCRKLGMDEQSLEIAERLLGMDPSETIREDTLQLLSAVYRERQEYDRAALALMGQWQ